MVSPDRGCVGADVDGVRYSGRFIETDNPQHARALKDAGYFPASLGGVARARGGYDCPVCGFRSFFASCSRCRDREVHGGGDAA